MTIHRPANVDQPEQLSALIKSIEENVNGFPVIFPVHPRTRKTMETYGIKVENIKMVDPLGYLEFNYLVNQAKGVITDSGGITEETTVMGVPCMTLRNSTERPETCDIGTNELIGTDPAAIAAPLKLMLNNEWKKGSIPPLWDGQTGERIVDIFLKLNVS
jgi:UDP-N-acetylglucosamine 2-epimerase (non-hydrolysing)